MAKFCIDGKHDVFSCPQHFTVIVRSDIHIAVVILRASRISYLPTVQDLSHARHRQYWHPDISDYHISRLNILIRLAVIFIPAHQFDYLL